MSLPPLHSALVQQQLPALESALSGGADPNAVDPIMGNAPLHLAAQIPDSRFLQRLIDAGALINQQTPQHGVTALMVAVWHRQPDNVALLLAQPTVNLEIVAHFGMKAEALIDFGASSDDAFGRQQSTHMAALFAEAREQRATWQARLLAFNIVVDAILSDAD
ncbi:hypothetical protein Maes01_00565 [Microbulbifer aestuariivivens]|uniref:Ankyrin repeat domain-containing protein n=1 Tax=Microbulbifer aestuariivivens TaxID=1908308 RepID=A0ABP9WLE0_9GAMM